MKIDELTMEAIREKLEDEFTRVAANILDVNTSAKTKREVTLKLSFAPNERNREQIEVGIIATAKLAPAATFKTDICIGYGSTGELIAVGNQNRSIFEMLDKKQNQNNEVAA